MIVSALALLRRRATHLLWAGLATWLLLISTLVPYGHAADWVAAPPGLIAWWPGDGDARDIVGQHHGILRGGSTADVDAYIGKGFSFDGTNKYVEIPNSPELNLKELSVECWVRFDNLDAPGTSAYIGQQYLVFKQNTRFGDFEGYVLSKDRTHADIILWEVTSAAGKLVRIDSASTVATNEWYHLVGVRGPNYIKLYFNGKLEAQAAVDFPQDYGNHPLYFGTSGQDYYDRRLNGVMDEVCIYRRALTSLEIAALYSAGKAGKSRPAQVTVTGRGYVSPNYNHHLLRPGREYYMTAYPAAGYVFSNWTGSVVSSKRTVAFPAEKSLVLQANFVPNPFKAVAGAYRGLFHETAEVRHESSGSALLLVTSRGTFTGTIFLGGTRCPVAGKFDLEGRSVVVVPRRSLEPATLRLELDLHQGTDRISGTVSNSTWTAELIADRRIWNEQTAPCPQAGYYTFAMEGVPGTSEAPAGATIGSVSITKGGLVTLTGMAADGFALARSSAISKSGQWPFYVPLYGGAGSLLGWITFEDDVESDLSGSLKWTRPPIANARFYPGGFELEGTAVGSRYHRPLAGEKVLDVGAAFCEFAGGNLPEPVIDYIELTTANKVTSTNGLRLEFRLPSGLLSGSVTGLENGKQLTFKGVVLQKPSLARGYFRGTNESGALLIHP